MYTKRSTIYAVGNPCLTFEQVQTCGGVKLAYGITNSLDSWISYGNTDINNWEKNTFTFLNELILWATVYVVGLSLFIESQTLLIIGFPMAIQI